MGEGGEVERLEGAGVCRGNDKDGAGFFDAVLSALLFLHSGEYLIGPVDLGGVRVRPGPHADAVPPGDDPTSRGDHGRWRDDDSGDEELGQS